MEDRLPAFSVKGVRVTMPLLSRPRASLLPTKEDMLHLTRHRISTLPLLRLDKEDGPLLVKADMMLLKTSVSLKPTQKGMHRRQDHHLGASLLRLDHPLVDTIKGIEQ